MAHSTTELEQPSRIYLVTGGAGFIGSHLVDALLKAGYKVIVLDDLSTGKTDNIPAGARFIQGSITDPVLVREAMAGCDGCFHLAAISSVERCNEDWLGTHAVNVTGALIILDTARSCKVPVVYASSAAVFGANQDLPLDETARPQPLSAYAIDKRAVEVYAQIAWTIHGVPSVGVRFFNVYGPRQNPHSPYSGVISIFADRLASGQDVTIYGDGSQTRDFLYVGDAVKAMMLAMQANLQGAELFNVCTGSETSLLQLVDTLGNTLAVEPHIAFGPCRVGDVARSVGNPALLQRKLGFKPEVTLQDGLTLMLLAS